MEACAPAPSAFGRNPNSISWYRSCRSNDAFLPLTPAQAGVQRPRTAALGPRLRGGEGTYFLGHFTTPGRVCIARTYSSVCFMTRPLPRGNAEECHENRKCDRPRAALSVLFASAALAQVPGYPDRPVKIIVPFAAAGPTDVVARLIAQKLSEKFGQQFYIENIAGAGGNLAMGAAAKAPADGCTILFVSSSFTVNPSLYAKAPYDAEKDFAPVTKAAGSPNGLFVHPDIPAKSVKELVELIRANPGKYTFASPGIGTAPHLPSELFKLTFGLDFALAPFAGGAPSIQSVVAGHTPMCFQAIPPATALVKDGKLRALAVTAA